MQPCAELRIVPSSLLRFQGKMRQMVDDLVRRTLRTTPTSVEDGDDPEEAKRQSLGLPVRLMQHRKSAAGLEIPCPPGSALSQTGR
jgi:hypothetical protein